MASNDNKISESLENAMDHDKILRSSTSYQNSVDVEKQAQNPTESINEEDCAQQLLVTWNGPHNSLNPQNWHQLRRWTVTVLASLGGLVTLMSSTMIAPALSSISRDLHMSQSNAQLTLSIFVLAFGLGPLVLAPCTEIFGRPVWLLSGVFYTLWSIVCGFSSNKSTLIASRLLSGLGGSVDFAIAYPVRSDVWRPEERGKSFAIASFLPLLGPAIGPIIGGVITQAIGWRWLFWVLAIFDGVLVMVGFFLFPETSAARILGNKAKRLRKETGLEYHTEYEGPNMKLTKKLRVSLIRPAQMLATQPIVQLVSLFMTYTFGVLYIVLSTFATLYTDKYHESISKSGLHYIAVAIGYTLANQVGGKFTDSVWKRLTAKAEGATSPEYRVVLMIPGGLLIPIGLFWYGWSAEARLHWIMPDIGTAIFGCGFILMVQAMGAYILDCFGKYTASASAASQVLGMVAGFVLPIFAPALYHRLGWGWGNTVLALISLIVALPAPLILWRYGPRLRAMSRPDW